MRCARRSSGWRWLVVTALALGVLLPASGAGAARPTGVDRGGTEQPPEVGGAPVGPAEDIFGGLDLAQVGTATDFPFSAVGFLALQFPNRNDRCTGFLVNRNTVLTAAHCLYDPALGGWVRTVSFTPAANELGSPFGSCNATRKFILTAFITDTDADLGAVKLDCNVGRQTGSIGVYDVNWTGERAHVVGFPTEAGLVMMRAAGDIQRGAGDELRYKIDTLQGESGGPVLVHTNPPGSLPRGWYAIGVHDGTAHTLGVARYNWGSRFTHSRSLTIQGWRQAAP